MQRYQEMRKIMKRIIILMMIFIGFTNYSQASDSKVCLMTEDSYPKKYHSIQINDDSSAFFILDDGTKLSGNVKTYPTAYIVKIDLEECEKFPMGKQDFLCNTFALTQKALFSKEYGLVGNIPTNYSTFGFSFSDFYNNAKYVNCIMQ